MYPRQACFATYNWQHQTKEIRTVVEKNHRRAVGSQSPTETSSLASLRWSPTTFRAGLISMSSTAYSNNGSSVSFISWSNAIFISLSIP